MIGIIYKVTNITNSKSYIGQTIQLLTKRRKQHENIALKKGNFHFHNALSKYGFENFTWKIMAYCYNTRILNQLEQYYIKECDTFKNGYNMTFGGETSPMSIPGIARKHGNSIRGRKRERNPKQSKRMMGKNNPAKTLEARKKISESKKGKKNPNYGKKLVFSEERNKKISKARKGMKFTEAHKEKLSEAAKKRNRQRDKFGRFL